MRAQAHFKPTGRALGRAVNVLIFTHEDWQRPLLGRNSLVESILAQPVVALRGELPRLPSTLSQCHIGMSAKPLVSGTGCT